MRYISYQSSRSPAGRGLLDAMQFRARTAKIWSAVAERSGDTAFRDRDVKGMKTVAAHFDGKQIVLEGPVKLTPHTKLKVIVAEEGESFSEPAFAKVWARTLNGLTRVTATLRLP